MTKSRLIWIGVGSAILLSFSMCLYGRGGGSRGDVADRDRGGVTSSASTKELRATRGLDDNWKFVLDATLTDEAALAATGADWDTVRLPHTWNAEDAAGTQATRPYERSIGWYRLELATPAMGTRHWLEFGAASIVADVWLNGRKLGQHRGAFTAFRFDITEDLARGGTNVLLVKVDNRAPASAEDPTAVAPLGGDFNMAGGLYRQVSLISTLDHAHFDLGDLGGPGVYATTTSIAKGDAIVQVRAKLRNDSARDAMYLVRASVVDDGGRLVHRDQHTVVLAAGGLVEIAQELGVPNARLWQGLADPYQYTLVVDLVNDRGAPIDRVVQRFGIRQMSFDPDRGFFLNGRNLRLRGVAMHQDYPGKAWAISERDTDESLALIEEIGANSIRLAHYPHGPYTLERTSELGMVVWAEHPLVNATTIPSCVGTPTDTFTANVKQQLQELIRQQYNHASVAMWSIANEVAVGCLMAPPASDNITPTLRTLEALASAEDPSRPTTLADFGEALTACGKPIVPTGGITEIWALNRYYLWYYGDAIDELGAMLEALHARYPGQAIGISEYGAGAALTHHTDNPLGGPPESINTGQPVVYQPEEYASYVHEQNWLVISSTPYVWGSYVWAMFDFGSGTRNEGDLRGISTKGLVTFDRETKKDAFYFYKANWSREPVTYVAGRRYTNRAYPVTEVRVYSNAEEVQLVVNGEPVGSRTQTQCPLGTCVFEGIELGPGVNQVTAIGQHGGRAVHDTIEWWRNDTGDLNIAAGQLTTGFTSTSGALFGSDNFFTGGTGDWLVPKAFPADDRDDTPVRGTRDPELFKNFRRGTFRYAVPIANGRYAVTLSFVEPSRHTRVGGRVFDVSINGKTELASFDVLREAGRYRTVVTRTVPAIVSKGHLDLAFTPSKGEAIVSNIRIERQ